jgi:hypothetical protein
MLSSVNFQSLFSHYLKNGKIFEEKTGYWILLVCFHYLYKFVRNIAHSKKNWEKYGRKCILVITYSTHYHFQISIKLQFSRQIVENIPVLWKSNHCEPSSYMRTDGRTNRQTWTKRRVAFRKFAQTTLKTGIQGIFYQRKFRFSKNSNGGAVCRHRNKELHRK